MSVIEFHTYKHLDGIIPRPVPMNHQWPEWYKRMPTQMDPDDPKSATMKRCVPVRDAMSLGYMLPMWAEVQLIGLDEDISYASNEEFGQPIISVHSPDQVKGCLLADRERYGHMPLKFNNPWIIKTEPGWSCLFTSPIGHFEDRIEILTAVVDTDKYYNHINFPFILKKSGRVSIKKGEPLVQVVPFKREDWESSCEFDLVDEDAQRKAATNLGTHMSNAYKKEYWVRKNYR